MNIIKENLLFILFPILIFIYYVIPIDFIYFILLSPVIGFVEAVFLFIYEKKKRYSIGILIIDFFFIFVFYLLNVNLYFYYHKIWNILFFILNLTIISTSRQELEEKGYTLPEYAFTVESSGVKSEESGQLDVRDCSLLLNFPKHL